MNENMEERIAGLSLEIAGIREKAEILNEKILAVKTELCRKRDIIRKAEELAKPLLDEKYSEDVKKTAERLLKVLGGNS